MKGNKAVVKKNARFSVFAICVLALVALCGCSKNENVATTRTTSSQSSVESILQQRMAEADANNTANAAQVTITPVQNDAQNVANAQNVTQDSAANAAPVATAPVQDVVQDASVVAKNAFGKTISAQDTTTRIKPERPASKSVSVDVDLTALSSTMVYSEVLNIMTAPETYIGKTVKMNGIFAYYHNEINNQYYFGCIIQDATACCSQGIEFILTDDYIFPDDYPEEGDIVTVAGEFMTYEEDGFTYFTLKDSKLLS